MIGFVNIDNEESFQDKNGIPANCFGVEVATSYKPISFRYYAVFESDGVYQLEPATSFQAIKVDSLNNIIDAIDLDASLIQLDGSYHYCDGSTNYISELSLGLHYFIVNNQFQSDYFSVVADVPTTATDVNIAVSGLEFYDTGANLDYQERNGAPDIFYGTQFSPNTKVLQFRYLSSESITSFIAYKIDRLENIIEEIVFDTSLVGSDGTYHFLEEDTLTNYFGIGTYFLVINNKYKSTNFCVATLTCYSVENLELSEAKEDYPLNISFDAELIGIELNLELELTFSFNCGVDSFSETVYLDRRLRNFNFTTLIPDGVSGDCELTISSDLCEVTYSELFYITPSDVCCLELENGTNLELEAGGCLELENCESICFNLLDGDTLDLFSGGCLETLN